MERLKLFQERPQSPLEQVRTAKLGVTCSLCPRHTGTKKPCAATGSPGGLLVIGERATRHDDEAGSAFNDGGGTFLKSIVAKGWRGPIAYDVATRCYNDGRDVEPKHVDACRGFLAQTLQWAEPERIFAFGQKAILAVTGRAIQPLSVRRGYSWVTTNGSIVPVFFFPSETEAHANRFIKRYLLSDVLWATSATLPPPRWDAEVNMVETSEDAEQAVEAITSTSEGFAFDLEWAGYQFTKENKPLVLSASAVCGDGSVWAWDEIALSREEVLAPIKRALEDPDVPKGGANVKADQHTLLSLGVQVQGVTFDTRLMRKLLDTDASGALKDLQELVGMGSGKDRMAVLVDEASAAINKELTAAQKKKATAQIGLGFETPSRLVQAARKLGVELDRYKGDPKAIAYGFVPRDELCAYNAIDTLSTARGAAQLMLRMSKHPSQERIWNTIVLPATKAIARVEQWGIPLDVGATQTFASYLQTKIEEAETVIRACGDFDIESSQQLGEFLYKKLKLPIPAYTETGRPSTDEESLTALKEQGHPLPGYILTFRHYKKLSNYTRDWLHRVRDDGRVHPSIHLDGARCLPAGELVLTSRGYLPVEHVKRGDLVLTHEGRPRRVIETFSNPERPIIRVRLANGLVLRTTEDHEYMTSSGWVLAKDLKVGTPVQVHSEAERWRPIEGWPYLVSSWGRVKHIKPRAQGQGALALQPKYRGSRQGHLKVTLVRGDRKRATGGRADFGVHQLVLQAFGPRPEASATETRHLNGIPWDNTAENLAWGTAAQNRADAVRHGGDFAKNTRVLSAKDVAFIRAQPRKPHGGAGRWAKTGVSDSHLAAQFGVSREQVRDIRSGKKWLDPRAPDERAEGRRAVFTFAPVLSVELESPALNFGLNVEEDHSHVTAGIITHNSGRTSSSDPNMQNVPSEKRDPVDGKSARDCFAAPKGYTLLQADYSQLELRIAAELSNDDTMRDLFKSGIDFHLGTAKLISKLAWGIEPDKVTKMHRSGAKSFNFGLLYGKTDRSLAAELGIDIEAAASIRQGIFGAFKQLGKWHRNATQQALEEGGCWTYWEGQPARWRPLTDLGDRREARKGYYITALNGAVNSPIQGTASDFCIASLARAVQEIEAGKLNAQLILPIHDSMMFLVPNNAVDEVAAQVKQIMTSYAWCKTPLEVDVEIGEQWGSLEKYGGEKDGE